ncbi:MAG: TIGR01906 family membrane protein [Erysipelotrichaceae bacterium]
MMHAKSYVSTFFGVLLILVLLLTSIDVFSLDRAFFLSEYKKLDVAADIGVSEADLVKSTDVLLGYLRNTRKDLNVTVTIDGTPRQMFNQKEIDHMVDVKVLYRNAILFRNLSLIIGSVIGVLMFAMYRRKAIRLLSRGIVNASIVFGVILAFVAVYASVDFYGFWTQFHQLFFRNNLWLLDPNTDNLILMVPEPFFFALVFRIVGGFTLSLILINVLAYFGQKKGDKHESQSIETAGVTHDDD